ncbi:MAG: 16S rRNA (guanine(966)-N(2))-methyltransferase RsmD [Candidatus Omnitrophica bacterium]|nr:16S rRNA (guanine(966)-N(2))-methyltransferase RsmD [Candidatus Omnitrophota bacterium]
MKPFPTFYYNGLPFFDLVFIGQLIYTGRMKIIGGQFKGRNFFRPDGIRPMQSAVAKSLFDILGQDMEGIIFLDLFAGSGSVGIEALSRGAKHCTFVEKDAKCADTISKNLRHLDISAYSLIKADSFAAIKQIALQKQKYDIVFIDPPYARELGKKSLKTLEGYVILHASSTVVIKHDKYEILPEEYGRFRLFRQKKYGSTALSFYQVKEAENSSTGEGIE